MSNPSARARTAGNPSPTNPEGRVTKSRAESLIDHTVEKCVLAYHEILPQDSKYLYRVTTSQLREHLSFLASLNPPSKDETITPVITFDDGHRSNFEEAFPLLEQFGVKGIFFVLAGRLDGSDAYLTWNQARQMIAAGHRVESHGWSHRLLTQCTASDLEEELVRSKHELESRLGTEILAISAPGGRWDDRVADACASAGYKELFHSNPWANTRERKGLRLQGRHMITGKVGPRELEGLLQAGQTRRFFSMLKYGTKEGVREILGDRLYHKLWCWLANWKPEEGLELEVDSYAKEKRETRHT